jgi:hypothetical protein
MMAQQKSVTGKKKEAITPNTSRTPTGSDGQASSQSAQPSTPPTTDSDLISNMKVLNILSNLLGPLMPVAEFQYRTTLADNEYLETEPGFVVSAIVTDPILSVQSYHAEIFDCDDYVLYLKTKLSLYAASNRFSAPLAVGYLFTTNHAFNFCIGSSSILHLINTQSESHPVTCDPTTFSNFLSIGPSNRITTIYI